MHERGGSAGSHLQRSSTGKHGWDFFSLLLAVDGCYHHRWKSGACVALSTAGWCGVRVAWHSVEWCEHGMIWDGDGIW